MFFGSKQGLSNSRIRSITEDSRHNLWITTQNGLNRYDGVKMNVYRHEVDNPLSLLYDETTCVLEYEKGKRMLVGTGMGVQMYDYATDRFVYIPFVRENGDTVHARVVNIDRIEDKRVMACYAGYGCGELKVDDKGYFVIVRTSEFDVEGASPVRFYASKKRTLWMINGHNDLFRHTRKKLCKHDELSYVRNLCESSSGTLYAGTYNNGFYRYDPAQSRFVRILSPEQLGGAIVGIRPWTEGRLFISTDGGGVRVYDERNGKLQETTITVKDFDLATSNVSDAMCDTYGNVWVGVYMKGLVVEPFNQSAFDYIGSNSVARNTIGKNSVFAICEAVNPSPYEKGLWVTADNDGLYLVSADGTASLHWNAETTPGMPHAFTAMYDTPSALMLGTFYDGLWKMVNGRFVNLTKEINRIFDIRPANEPHCFWVASVGDGVFYYNDSTRTFVNYRNASGASGGGLNNPYVFTLQPVGNSLFVGSADGITVCHVGVGGKLQKAATRIPGHYTVRHFAVSPDSATVWAATNEGLVRIDRRSLATTTYTTSDGLPANSVTSLCVDGDELWIGTDFGLSCMDVSRARFVNFFVDDGLQDNEFSRGAVASLDGRFYFSGIGGITFFKKKAIEEWRHNECSLHLRLVDVLIDGRPIHKGDYSGSYEMLDGLVDDCERLDLCHNDNHFSLELGVEGLSNRHVVYEYSIDNGRWMEQGGDGNRIIFDNLRPGTYHIRVRARISGMCSEVRTLVAVVHPAWYASLVARLVYVLIFIGLCLLAYEYAMRRLKLRRIMQRARQQRQLNETRMQFFMNISHEIRTPMTLILAPLEKMMARDKDSERQKNYALMKQNAQRILRLINQMMDVRKIEQGKFLLDYRKVELVAFVRNIVDVFASNAHSRGIDYEFVCELEQQIVYIDPDNMDKVVMNLLSNAFKFTPDGGRIVVRLAVQGETFTLEVADSGVGIPDEEKPRVFERFHSSTNPNGFAGTGIGLNLASLLVDLHKGSIRVDDNPGGQGTVFTVVLPLGEPSLQDVSANGGGIQYERTGGSSENEATESGLLVEKSTDAHGGNLLLVEDDEAICSYVKSELSADMHVHSCSNGQEAWDYILSHPGKVDIVVSDVMMPVMDGMTLCQKVKSNFTTVHIPVVLMTALGSDSDRIAGLSHGADAYISKPFNIDVLRSVVLQQVRMRRLLQGKFHGDRQQEEKIDKLEMDSPDEHLMTRVMKVVNENLDNPELSVEIIADKVGISRVHFYRKMKALTGQSPRDFVKYVRLKEAARLLAEKNYDITGVCAATGFKSLSSFSTAFKSLYGVSPSEWVKRHRSE